MRVVEQGGDLLAAAGVAGKYDVASHVAGDTVDVVLVIQFLHGRCLLIYTNGCIV